MWNTGLSKTIKDPNYVVYSDSRIVIIKDMYPKAKYHFLVIPQQQVDSIQKLNGEHISLLVYMENKGKEYVEKNTPGVIFRYGYHAVPSMQRLHLHIISNDMISNCLKTKKHYNSFTTLFFISSEDVIKKLTNDGSLKSITPTYYNAFLSADLKCHICDSSQSNMPKLKNHLLTHS